MKTEIIDSFLTSLRDAAKNLMEQRIKWEVERSTRKLADLEDLLDQQYKKDGEYVPGSAFLIVKDILEHSMPLGVRPNGIRYSSRSIEWLEEEIGQRTAFLEGVVDETIAQITLLRQRYKREAWLNGWEPWNKLPFDFPKAAQTLRCHRHNILLGLETLSAVLDRKKKELKEKE